MRINRWIVRWGIGRLDRTIDSDGGAPLTRETALGFVKLLRSFGAKAVAVYVP